MTYLPAAAHARFAAQHGVASLQQLLDSGLSSRQVEHLTARGALVSRHRGAYRSPSLPETEMMRCAEICLAHDSAIVGGPTAGRVHGFRRVSSDRRVHITTPRGGNPITTTPGVITFHTDAIRPVDIDHRRDGLRVMTPARTAMDLARLLRDEDLRSVVEQAMHDRSLEVADMLFVGADFAHRRPWIQRFMRTVDDRVAGGAAESHAEVRVGQALLQRSLTGLVRQYRLSVADRTIRFDLAVPRLKWAIEVDVFPTHAETAGALADRRRDHDVGRLGWIVSRVSRSDYHDHFAASIDDIVNRYRQLCHQRSDDERPAAAG